MLVQISSGTGPIECELAVDKFFESIKKEHPKNNFKLIKRVQSRFSNGAKSILFETDAKLNDCIGSIQWIRDSVRDGHKRKNWYIDVSAIPNVEELKIDDKDLEIEFFHSGGKGGQNVNKVETGVRIRHIASGIYAESTKERTQHQNRKDAFEKLKTIFKQMYQEALAGQKNVAWSKHNELQRGNPIRIYKGDNFKRIK